MNRLLSLTSLVLLLAGMSSAAELQGVITDWNCTQDMVRHGREKVLQQRHSCSLADNIQRSVYGLITDDKKFYRIDPDGNARVVQMLKDTPDKNTLKVVISGDLQGNTIKINTISEL